jgi:hypothetical protein
MKMRLLMGHASMSPSMMMKRYVQHCLMTILASGMGQSPSYLELL